MPLKSLILVNAVNAASPSSTPKRSSLIGRDISTLGVHPSLKAPSGVVSPTASFSRSAVKTGLDTPSKIPVRPISSSYAKTAAPSLPMKVGSDRRSSFPAPVENIASPSRIPITTAIARGMKRLMGRREGSGNVSTPEGSVASDTATAAEIRTDMRSSSPASSITVAARDVCTTSPPATKISVKKSEQKAAIAIFECTKPTFAEPITVGEGENGVFSKPQETNNVSGLPAAVRPTSQLNCDISTVTPRRTAEDRASPASSQFDDEDDLADLLASFPLPPGAVRFTSQEKGEKSFCRFETDFSPLSSPNSIAQTASTVAPLRVTPKTNLPTPRIPANGCTIGAPLHRSKTATRSVATMDKTASRPRTVAPFTIHPTEEDEDILFVDLVADIHRNLNPIAHKFGYPLVALSTAADSPTIAHREEDFEDFERRMQASSNPLPVTVAHTFGNTTISLGEALELRKAARARGESGGLNSLITPSHFRAGRRPPTRDATPVTPTSQTPFTPSTEGNVRKRGLRGCSVSHFRRLGSVQEEEENEASSVSPSTSSARLTAGVNVLAESPLSRIIALIDNDVNASSPVPTVTPLLRASAVKSHVAASRTIKLPCLTPYSGEIDLVPRKRPTTMRRASRDSAMGVLVPSHPKNSDVAWWTDRGALALKETVVRKYPQPARANRSSLHDKENVAPLKRQSRVERRNGRIF